MAMLCKSYDERCFHFKTRYLSYESLAAIAIEDVLRLQQVLLPICCVLTF